MYVLGKNMVDVGIFKNESLKINNASYDITPVNFYV